MSSAAALASDPARVKKLFLFDNYPAEGIFAIRLFRKGLPIILTIDDQIPTLENNWPLYARPSASGAWWVVLIEKAFAKMNVNY